MFRWRVTGIVFSTMLAAFAAGTAAGARDNAKGPAAAQRMLTPGPEDRLLAAGAGKWSVVSTLKLAPDAQPIVSQGIVATRKMIGPYLQEIMAPAPGSKTADFRRISYLSYFRVEGCWQYVSMDTRFPVGIMPAKTCEKEENGKLTLEFQPLPFVGFGQDVEGRTVNSNMEITRDGPDREIYRQYWTQADGTGRRWLAVQYEYRRVH